MQGKVVMVTGATDGIGRSTAEALAARGARVLAVGRNRIKGDRCVADIRENTGHDDIGFFRADLSRQQEVRQLARTICTQQDRLDVLINNAGGLFAIRRTSADGIEMTLALNHLAGFLLTGLLLELMQATPGARIVNVASHVHRRATLDFDDLQMARRYRGWTAYQRSKLCNLLFTYELARRLGASGPTVNALHPGFVRSHLGQDRTDNPLFGRTLAALAFRLAGSLSPAEGARTSIHLASSPDLAAVTGRYFSPGRTGAFRPRIRPEPSSAVSRDPGIAQRLWEASEKLTAPRRTRRPVEPMPCGQRSPGVGSDCGTSPRQ